MEESLPVIHLTTESQVTDEAENPVIVWHFDYRTTKRDDRTATLVKCGRKVHSMQSLGTLRLSKPKHFQTYGEGLIRDPGEGEASRRVTTAERIAPPEDLLDQQEFLDEVSSCASSVGQKLNMRVTSSKTTQERGTKIRFAPNCWIYSTAIEPATEREWSGLWESMCSGYDHADRITRPRQFALSLGLMAAEQLGAGSLEVTSTHDFGKGVVHTKSGKGQLIVHGPVLYVKDPFSMISSGSSELERGLLPVFVKNIEHAAQREYRFVVWTEKEPEEGTVDLKVSKAMLGSLDVEPVPRKVCKRSANTTATPWPSPQTQDDRPQLAAGQSVGPNGVDQDPAEAPAREAVTPRANVARGETVELTSDWFWSDLMGRSDDPARPFSRIIDVTDYAGNPRAAAAAAALAALRGKVEQVEGERRTKAASAAWHAEPWVSHLCRRFVDPIGSVRITMDDNLVVSLRFPEGVDATAEIAFGPKGAHYAVVNEPKMPGAFSHNLNPREDHVPRHLERWLSQAGMISCVEVETHEV